MSITLLTYCNQDTININNIGRSPKTAAGVSDEVYYETCRKYQTQTWIGLHPQRNELTRWKLSPKDVNSLKMLNQIRCAIGRDFKSSDLEHFSPEFVSFVKTSLEKFPQAFVRLSHKSFKNSFSTRLRPLTTTEDVFDALTSSFDILKTLDMPEQELFIMKWIHIDRRREYRVFIIESRVVGISQQECYKSFSLSPERQQEALSDAQLIVNYYHSNKSTFDSFGYQTVTLDVFVDEGMVKLIECNPPSLWGPSGSSLFREEDFTTIFHDGNVYIKIR